MIKTSQEELKKIISEKIFEEQEKIDKAVKGKTADVFGEGLEAIGFKKGVLWVVSLLKEYEVEE